MKHLATLSLVMAMLFAACGSGATTSTTPVTTPESGPASGDEGEVPVEAVLCGELWARGDPVVEPSGTNAEFSAAHDIIRNLASDQGGDAITGYGSGGDSSIYGRISLGLNTRDPDVIGMFLDLIDPRLLCFELPPVGYEDSGPVLATWVLDGALQPDATSIALLVDDPSRECGHDPRGRVLPPTVTETDTEIEIIIELELVPWGDAECEGWSPMPYVVELGEPVGTRTLLPPPPLAPPTATPLPNSEPTPDPADNVDAPVIPSADATAGNAIALVQGRFTDLTIIAVDGQFSRRDVVAVLFQVDATHWLGDEARMFGSIDSKPIEMVVSEGAIVPLRAGLAAGETVLVAVGGIDGTEALYPTPVLGLSGVFRSTGAADTWTPMSGEFSPITLAELIEIARRGGE